jgi:hypothetical protein
MKNNKGICDWIFQVFLMVYVYSDSEIDQILTVYINQSVEFKHVDIFVYL